MVIRVTVVTGPKRLVTEFYQRLGTNVALLALQA